MLRYIRPSLAIGLIATATALFWTPASADTLSRAAPEPASVGVARAPVEADRQMVVAAHPLASLAGLRALRNGGSAADAAIAAMMVLGLVEPQSAGLGGGAFLLHWDEEARALTSWDGRETAPAAATPERFLNAEGKPDPWPQMVPGGLSVGVPGLVAMLHDVHAEHGKLPWARLFDDAIGLANGGFGVSPRLAMLVAGMGEDAFSPQAQDYFLDPDGAAPLLGQVIENQAYADTLQRIADGGPEAFYSGEIAEDIVGAVTNAWRNPGDMTTDDIGNYRAIERPAVCGDYRGYKICGMGPPSSGGLAVAMTLRMLERFDLGKTPTPEALHLIGEAGNLAFADRNRYVADPDFVTVPAGLMNPDYLAERSALIDPAKAGGVREPGNPPASAAPSPGRDGTKEAPGTTQVSVIDADGNAVSMTASIESAFGSRLFVRGFLLNNELTDFSFAPADAEGRPIANRVEAGKRPRSSMAPTMVFDENGKLAMILGSPGGSRIIGYVVKAIIAMVDWGYDPQAAAALFNFASRNGPFEVEDVTGADRWVAAMEAFGGPAKTADMTSGLNIIAVGGGKLAGASDPRREGAAMGD
ncbi:gamma-glutamyltransferase [Microbaculum marinisediminis]|uniref:Glutathione hydrolase proenzyme n=1 Tax=Microbaculum marinisediminis TaxID=2931392 RepID=A0AAW5QUJ9_9HYPH|nr:gamma-glutamyltransferase [Microbaculum sp. A6E488]MCT8971595.1 gamma-glutamyltransferase [Microbaculum sp. A6E488]